MAGRKRVTTSLARLTCPKEKHLQNDPREESYPPTTWCASETLLAKVQKSVQHTPEMWLRCTIALVSGARHNDATYVEIAK